MLTTHQLIAAVILPGLTALVLACGPTAPRWQDGPTPPPGSGKLPKSLDGSPLLRGLVIEYEKMLAADDRDAVPAAAKLDWVEIFIYSHEESSDSAQRFLKSNGVEYGFPQAHSGDISTKSVLSSRIPLNLLRPIAEISTVRAVALHDLPDSPKIVPNLSELIVGYEVGIPHQPIYCTQGRKEMIPLRI